MPKKYAESEAVPEPVPEVGHEAADGGVLSLPMMQRAIFTLHAGGDQPGWRLSSIRTMQAGREGGGEGC